MPMYLLFHELAGLLFMAVQRGVEGSFRVLCMHARLHMHDVSPVGLKIFNIIHIYIYIYIYINKYL